MTEEREPLLVDLLNRIEISAKDIVDVLRGYVRDGLYINLNLFKRLEERVEFTEEDYSLAYQCVMKGMRDEAINSANRESYQNAKDYFKRKLDMFD